MPDPTSKTRLTVVASDDHPVVLSGIRLALRGSGNFMLLAEAADVPATLAAIREKLPDLLILDLWMGDADGIELLRQVHHEWPWIRVLVYSTSDERCYGVRSLRAGAAGYLMKSNGLDELLNALRIIAAGEHYFSPVIAAELIGKSLHPTPSLPSGLDTLSNREIQILRLIGMGRTTAFISKDLSISAKTVGVHRENLKDKLNAGNSASLVRKAIQLVENRFL